MKKLLLTILLLCSCNSGNLSKQSTNFESSNSTSSHTTNFMSSSTSSSKEPEFKNVTIRIGLDSDRLVSFLQQKFTSKKINGIKLEFYNEPPTFAASKIEEHKDIMPDIQSVMYNDVENYIDSFAEYDENISLKLQNNSIEKYYNFSKPVFVPYFYHGYTFAYNRAMLSEFGLDMNNLNENGIPVEIDTFEKIFALSSKYYNEGYKTYNGFEITKFLNIVTNNLYFSYPFLTTGGWKMFSNPEDSLDIGINSNEFKEGLNFYAAAADAKVNVEKLGNDYLLTDPNSLNGYNYHDFYNDRFPMSLVPSYEYYVGQNIDDYMFSPLPTWKGNQPSLLIKVDGFVINKYSKNIDAAKYVLNYLYSDEFLSILTESNFHSPLVLCDDYAFNINLSNFKKSQSLSYKYSQYEQFPKLPNNPNKKISDVYYGIGIEHKLTQIWLEASTHINDRDSWISEIHQTIINDYNNKFAELDALN